MNSKIQTSHLERKALVYVRQSTFVQVQKNRESTLRQYDLAARAEEWGWRREQIVVIDEDQGRSGASTEGRSGFAQLMSEVALGQVGIVLAIEASRFARNNADWQRLIWFCSMTETLLGDQDAVYDPSLLDDRMVLGLKGTISELEWHTIRKRMHQAARAKAQRGALEITPPAGYEWVGGALVLSPDRQVVETLRTVFTKFDELGTARQVTLWLRDQQIKLPRRTSKRPGAMVGWVEAMAHAVRDILGQPAYAGAYAYGRQKVVRTLAPDGTVRRRTVAQARSEWPVLIRDHHEGFISWEQFERNQKQLLSNYTKAGMSGTSPAREGAALLQGLAHCGLCGRRMGVAYVGHERRFGQFLCRQGWNERGTDYFCQVLGGRRIEEAVVQLFLEAVEPAGIEVALRALEGLKAEQQRVVLHWQQQQQRAEYEAQQARERFDAVDARNRLVAAELERRWNEALTKVEEIRRDAQPHIERLMRELSDLERERVRRMGQDVHRAWTAPTTTARDKKRLLRAAIAQIVLTAVDGAVKVAVHWKGGEVTELSVQRPRRGEVIRATDSEVVELVRRLAVELDDTQIARVLSRKGMRTATGLTFTQRRVQTTRVRYGIACAARPSISDETVYTAEQAAKQLGVSSTTVHQWLRVGLLRGKQVTPGAPWCIVIDDETRTRLGGQAAPPGGVGLEEAAQRLGVTKQTVATWVKQGKLEAVRVVRGRRSGWSIRVDSSECERQPRLL